MKLNKLTSLFVPLNPWDGTKIHPTDPVHHIEVIIKRRDGDTETGDATEMSGWRWDRDSTDFHDIIAWQVLGASNADEHVSVIKAIQAAKADALLKLLQDAHKIISVMDNADMPRKKRAAIDAFVLSCEDVFTENDIDHTENNL